MSEITRGSSFDLRRRAHQTYVKRYAWQGYHPIEEGIPEADRQGVDMVYLDLSSREDAAAHWSPEKVARVNELQKAHCIQVLGHSNYRLPLASETREVAAAALKALKGEITVCAQLSAPLIVHGGPGAETRGIREAKEFGLEVLAANLAKAQRFAHDVGVQLILENLADHRKPPLLYFACTTQEMQQLLSAVSGLMALVDVGHANVNGGDPVKMFRQLADRVWGLSLSNNEGVHDSHLPLDQGCINFLALREAFEETGWRGVVGFETRGASFAADHAFLEAIERTHEMRRTLTS